VGRTGKVHSQPCASACFDIAYRLKIKLHDESGHLAAHYLLPYEFTVKANGNGAPRGGAPRGRTPARQQALRRGLTPPPAPTLDPRSPEPPASSQHSQLNSNHMAPVLQMLSPDNGPVNGGPIILISGINFPPPIQQQVIYVKFGTTAVPAVRSVLLSQRKTYSIFRTGEIHIRSHASCLFLRLDQVQSRLHSLYFRSPEDHNSATVAARLHITRNVTKCWSPLASRRAMSNNRNPAVFHSSRPSQAQSPM
jgi:hypothetical protein